MLKEQQQQLIRVIPPPRLHVGIIIISIKVSKPWQVGELTDGQAAPVPMEEIY